MPNLAATEISRAGGRSTRTLSLALFFLIVASGIVHVGAQPSVDHGSVRASLVLPFVLLAVAPSAARYRALHTLF
ncbi:hypothetical protein [Burkholderia diffusa]|uniref:hypothetical protein n=1 Tax=Burkholderia diffusa TaxID=488732 RepID=UPI00084180DA|nr:hypothetical protein [Burkholderia diffusa]AOI60436.1 hypothetical protein WI26_22975 [Burkholderia diffusa]